MPIRERNPLEPNIASRVAAHALGLMTVCFLSGCPKNTVPTDTFNRVFQQTPAHALICQVRGTGMPVEKVCTMINCGPQQTASQFFAAHPELESHRGALGGYELDTIILGGGGSVCQQCTSNRTTGVPMIRCPGLTTHDACHPGEHEVQECEEGRGGKFNLVTCECDVPCGGPEVCLAVGDGHQDDESFVSPTTASGFTLSSTDATFYQEFSGLGLNVPQSGIDVALQNASCSVRVEVGSGTSKPVRVEALDADGQVVDAKSQSPSQLHREDLVMSGKGMTQVRVQGGPEGVLFRVCARTPS